MPKRAERTFQEALDAAEYILTWNIQTNPDDHGGQFEVAIQILLMKQNYELSYKEALERATAAIDLAYRGSSGAEVVE